jgi:CheY-like chemotaxis protein
MSEAKSILVVDDDADVREFLSTALEDAGFDVRCASDGDAALEAVKSQAPDLISLDLIMPGKSGIKFLYELRRNRGWSQIPVIIVTGHARDELGGKDLDDIMSGAVITATRSYLEKPVKPDTFVESVCRQLGIDPPGDIEPSDRDALKGEVQALLDGADRKTLEKIKSLMAKES